MTVSPSAEVRMPQDKPPDWANSWMKWALTTPGIQKMVGQGVALLSFKGRRTGKWTGGCDVSIDRAAPQPSRSWVLGGTHSADGEVHGRVRCFD